MTTFVSAADLGYEGYTKEAPEIVSPENSPPSSPTISSQPGRHVWFMDARNTVHEFEGIDKEDSDLVQALWQQSWEMYEGKQLLKVKARRFRSTGLGILLADTFKDPNPHLCQKSLNAFTQLPSDLYNRGIERYLSKEHDMQRTKKKKQILQDVLAQARSLNSVRNMPSVEKQNILSLFAKHLSRDAELFARRIGLADEQAVDKESMEGAEIMAEYLKQLQNQKKMEQHRKDSRTVRASGNEGQNVSSSSQQQQTPSLKDQRLRARQA